MATIETDHGEARVPEEMIILNHDEKVTSHPHVVPQAWGSSEYQGSPSPPSYDQSRVTRDATFNSRNLTNLGKFAGHKSVAFGTSQPRVHEDFDSVPRARAQRRNSVSSYLPSRSVKNTPQNSDSFQSQGIRNSFHQVQTNQFQKFEAPTKVHEELWDNNRNDVSEPQFDSNHSRDLIGRRVGRRHSVTSLSSSYSAENFTNLNQTPRYDNSLEESQKRALAQKRGRRSSQPHVDTSNSENHFNGDTWCQKPELEKHSAQNHSAHEPRLGRESSARARRRASCSVISESGANNTNLLEQSDEGLFDLISALKRDINPQNLDNPAKVPEKTGADFRNRIPIAKDTSSSLLISNQNLLTGSHVEVRRSSPPLGHSGTQVIHLPDTGACPVTPRQEPVNRAPPFKDTHISLVYSQDLSVSESLEDVLKCAQAGLGTNLTKESFKNEKKHHLVNSQGHAKVGSQGHSKVRTDTLTISQDISSEQDRNPLKSDKENQGKYNKSHSNNNQERNNRNSGYLESCSKSDRQEGKSGKRSEHNGNSGHENTNVERRPTQTENHQIRVDNAEKVDYTDEQDTYGKCLVRTETSVKSSQGSDNLRPGDFANCDRVGLKHDIDKERCVTGCHREDPGGENSFEQNDRQPSSRNNFVKVQDLEYSESRPRNTHFDKRPVTFELRSSAPQPGLGRPRSYSLDSGTRGLLRQECVDEDDSSSSDSSECEPSSLDSDSSEESAEEYEHLKESSPEVKPKKPSRFERIKRSLTAPDGLASIFKKSLRKNHRPSTSGDIYTINEEISPDAVSAAQEENPISKSRREERPKSLGDDIDIDEAFKTFAEKANQRKELREQNLVVSEHGPTSAVPKKSRLDLRRKSLYDDPGIFEKIVSIVEAAEEQSQESVLSGGTTTESVFSAKNELSSAGESDNESEDETESDSEDERCFFTRFSAPRTSVRRASIDFGCLDQVNRAHTGKVFKDFPVSASLSDHNLQGLEQNLYPRCSDNQIMGYAMAQNQSSQNSMQAKMVAEAGNNGDATRDYLREYRRKFGQNYPDQSESRMSDGKLTPKSDSDSSGRSGDALQPSRTAQALANPSIRRYLLQSQARPGSRPSSRSSSPGLPDSGPHSPQVKTLLSNTEFFFSSSENSPNDSPRGSLSEYRSSSLQSSMRRDVDAKSRLTQRRSSSEMNLDQLGLMQQGKSEGSKSGRAHTDPFPERSRSPREILELSQRSMSEASDQMPETLTKRHSDSTFQEIMKRSSLKSKFHIPTFEEFKLKKKTTFSNTLDYIGGSQSKSSSHQPMKGVHSKLLVDQVQHARSMTALHELDQESDEDDDALIGGASKPLSRSYNAAGSAKSEQNLHEQISSVQNAGLGSLNDNNLLKAPPRRRHRSSDSRRSDDGLSPRGRDDSLPRRPKSMHVDSGVDHEEGLSFRRTGSGLTLDLDSSDSYHGAEPRRRGGHAGGVSVPGVTVTESNLDTCARPKKPERRQRKKSRSMIDLSKTDLAALEQAHRGKLAQQSDYDTCERSSSVRVKTKHHHRLRSGSSEHDLDKSEGRLEKGQGHSEKHKRHKSGDKLTKTKSEPLAVDLGNKDDGHRRSKSEKSRRVKESHGRRHPAEAGVDIVDGNTGSNRNSPHLRIDTSANHDSSSPVPSPLDDGELVSPRSRKSKSRKSEKHKSSAKSSENLAQQELTRTESICKKLLKAHSMDNLNVLKKIHKHDKHEKVKGQRPVSMGVPVDIDLDDAAFGQERAPPQQRSRHEDRHQLSLPNESENKSMVMRSISDVTDARKDEKRRQKNKKIRSSKSDPFDEKGRRAQTKLREARSHQHLVPDSSETHNLESSLSFQSIGDMDEEDDTSSEVPLKKSSGRKPKKTSNVSTTSVDSGVIGHDGSHDNDELSPFKDGSFSIEVERVDSGVGSETKYGGKKDRKLREGIVCVDCDKPIPAEEQDIITEVATICKKCISRRTERKETIQEIIDTEVSYGRDLKIIKEEFLLPMQNASLLTGEQMQAVFLNLQELTDINDRFADFLQDAVENANEQGDEDFHTVQIGKIFLDFSFMFIAFENYCVNQSSASLLLEQMEKERELLRIFLQVSQRDNQLLRRMNLKSFLMVPVQRIVKYPLLLTRLYKSTPQHNSDRELIKEAQLKIEEILDHINASAKGGGGGIRARTKGSIMRRGPPGTAAESVEIQKVAFETIGKNRNDAFCVMMGRLQYATPTEYSHWTKKGKGLKFSPLQAVVLALGKNKSEYSVEEDLLLFPRKSRTSEALMVLLKEKNGKYVPAREPLSLDKCVISMDPDFDEVFEVHEINKETLFFKADDTKENVTWARHLKYQAKDVGAWRRRRQALANIMFSKA